MNSHPKGFQTRRAHRRPGGARLPHDPRGAAAAAGLRRPAAAAGHRASWWASCDWPAPGPCGTSANVAVKFRTAPDGAVTYTLYRDGDGDGVLNRDIDSGVDPQVEPPRRLSNLGRGFGFGFPPGPPVPDPGSPGHRVPTERSDPLQPVGPRLVQPAGDLDARLALPERRPAAARGRARRQPRRQDAGLHLRPRAAGLA